ncbi:unnamed protein product [Amoebophrya sp. A120]|nr:unnamed protein product [Amoebophrya sp. A120]|eukprot:GSA120T00011023001.1
MLIKYNTPILISTSGGKGGKKEVPTMSQTEDILNSILPPREWIQDDQLWVQYVASIPATRADVVNLQKNLDKALQSRQARETGICPIREELYAQTFDELIRQCTIICAERGLLLLRVRDEIRMTICAYQTLYESSIAFGMRKALMAEQRRNSQNKKLKALTNSCAELEQDVVDLKQQILNIESREKTRRETESAKHAEETDGLRRQNAAWKEQLESLLSAPRK